MIQQDWISTRGYTRSMVHMSCKPSSWLNKIAKFSPKFEWTLFLQMFICRLDLYKLAEKNVLESICLKMESQSNETLHMDGSFATKLLNTIEQDWQESLAHGFFAKLLFFNFVFDGTCSKSWGFVNEQRISCLMTHVQNVEISLIEKHEFMFNYTCSNF
jgi:hypothetical protein